MFTSVQLEQYQAQMATLQEDVEYVRGLNEAIQHCFRPLSATEESLENVVRAMARWVMMGAAREERWPGWAWSSVALGGCSSVPPRGR